MGVLFALALASAAQPAAAQEAGKDLVIVPTPAPEGRRLVLPKNTPVMLTMNGDLNGKTAKEGSMFDLSVAQDVLLDGNVIIPKGARGVGEVTWATGKGMFGKSGKMNIDLRYVEIGSRRLPVSGSYRQEGEGNTVATVGTVIVASVFGALVTGRSALIPKGRELEAHTAEDLPIIIASPRPEAGPPALVISGS